MSWDGERYRRVTKEKMIHNKTSGIELIFHKLALRQSGKSGVGEDFEMN
jgi:hypothetical protein